MLVFKEINIEGVFINKEVKKYLNIISIKSIKIIDKTKLKKELEPTLSNSINTLVDKLQLSIRGIGESKAYYCKLRFEDKSYATLCIKIINQSVMLIIEDIIGVKDKQSIMFTKVESELDIINKILKYNNLKFDIKNEELK